MIPEGMGLYMEERIANLKKRAENMMADTRITVLKDEKEILEKLNEITKTEGNNVQIDEKTLDCFERYLDAKEKMQLAENDVEYLKHLAKGLKEQEIRKSDACNPAMFKITNNEGNEMLFLTRNALKEYSEVNSEDKYKVIEIPSSNSEELAMLLDIVKRNF